MFYEIQEFVVKRNSVSFYGDLREIIMISPKSRVKVCAQWRILKPPGSLLATDRSKAVVLV